MIFVNYTSQCGPNGRRDKLPPPAAIRFACDRQTNTQTNRRTTPSRVKPPPCGGTLKIS